MNKKILTHNERRERRTKMAEAVRGHTDIGVVARRFGVTIETVRQACRAAGVRASVVKDEVAA